MICCYQRVFHVTTTWCFLLPDGTTYKQQRMMIIFRRPIASLLVSRTRLTVRVFSALIHVNVEFLVLPHASSNMRHMNTFTASRYWPHNIIILNSHMSKRFPSQNSHLSLPCLVLPLHSSRLLRYVHMCLEMIWHTV